MSDGGYRDEPAGGARIRADVIDVYVVRACGAGHEFLQVLRAHEPLAGTWHPVMGHVERGERAWEAALRELGEEVGLGRDDGALEGLFALEQVHPFYLAALDCVVMSPRFVALVRGGWEPTLNDEHSAHRWVGADEACAAAMWPGQKRAIEEIRQEILRDGSLARERLRIATRAGG